jgi:hypothetical protein
MVDSLAKFDDIVALVRCWVEIFEYFCLWGLDYFLNNGRTILVRYKVGISKIFWGCGEVK